MLELIISLTLGIIAGAITGLLPGIHINLISALIISSLSFLLSFLSPLSLIVFITSMSISNLFLEFIPSIFLGAPDESALSVLPGHKLLLEGRAYEAARYSLTGCMLSIPLLIILIPVFIFILPKIFYYLRFTMLLILVSISIYMIANNKDKFSALIIFFISGFLGISTLYLNINQSLLPLLSGLFGASSLISSIRKKEKIPIQKITKPEISKKDISETIFSSILASPLCSFLPALGSSQAAIIGTALQENENPENKNNEKESAKRFLMLLGSVNFLVMSLSFITLYSINKSRTGSSAAVSEILKNITPKTLLVIVSAIILASFISFCIAIFFAKIFSKNINRINYRTLSIVILALLSITILIFSNLLGFFLYLFSSFAGLLCIELSVRRTNLMGCLMIPSILLYL